jgi:hypothetical protein
VEWAAVGLASLSGFLLAGPVQGVAIAALAGAVGSLAGRTWTWRWAWAAALFVAAARPDATLGWTGSLAVAAALGASALVPARHRAAALVALAGGGLAATWSSARVFLLACTGIGAGLAWGVQRGLAGVRPTGEHLRAAIRLSAAAPFAMMAAALLASVHLPSRLGAGWAVGFAVASVLGGAQGVGAALALRSQEERARAGVAAPVALGLLSAGAALVPGLPLPPLAAAALAVASTTVAPLAGWLPVRRPAARALVAGACAGLGGLALQPLLRP